MARTKAQTDDLIQRIRENFQFAFDYWLEIRDQAKTDLAAVAGDAWDPAERARREKPPNPRPCLSLDELGQYINQTINGVREARRAIKVIPTGSGATDAAARLRADKIRNIEYDSKAQSAYTTAFEGAVNCGWGACRINTAYVSPGDPFDKSKKIVIRRIPNQFSIYPDPDFREADGSDMTWLFVIDSMAWDRYRREYPEAEVRDFAASANRQDTTRKWGNQRSVQIGEYWEVDKVPIEYARLADGRTVTMDLVPDGVPIIARQKGTKRQVTQYITNGSEILEEHPWPGKYIPIALCIGKELWIEEAGGEVKRVWESQVRHAIDPQRLYNYYKTTEAELVRMIPKAPFVAAEGQLEGYEDDWSEVNDTPKAFIYHKAVVSGVPGVLPPPERPRYDPPIQNLELGAEAARRAIQASMGIMPLPTVAQQRNEKSGIALTRIQDSTQKGSFHFVDNHERFLMHCGRIVNDLLDKVIDTERDEVFTSPDGKHEIKRINGETDWGQGDYDITISTGASYQSEREQVDEFMNVFFGAIASLPVPEPAKAQLVALAIRLKDLGPLGEQMAEVIFPQANEQIPPPAQAALAQMQQRLQLAEATITQLMQEKAAKMAELATKVEIAKASNDTKLAIAEIETKAQILSERMAALEAARADMHNAAHEVGLSMLEGQQQQQQPPAAQGAPQAGAAPPQNSATDSA